jgi:cell volume regulation protein A
MTDVETFSVAILIAATAVTLAVLSNRLTERLRVPAPAIFLICAAIAANFLPGVHESLSVRTVERIVVVALVAILFDGGMHIGWRRFRSSAVPILWLGVVGTFATAGGIAVLAHSVFGLGWTTSMVLGTALSPTDPAVIFSVLGRREIVGRTGTILEGESGANDPVGIALMVGVLEVAAGGGSGWQVIPVEFAVQMAVGAAVGAAGGVLLLPFMRRVPLPSAGLYPLRTLAAAMAIYGLASLAHGSGFLAALVAGIVIGDARAPYKPEIERFHASVASLAEIVVFIVLGLSVQLDTLGTGSAWIIGLGLAVLLAFVVRPVFVGMMLLPVRLRPGERLFVLWGGLKGAVPILLGAFAILAGVPDSTRIYDIIFVVVAFSVVVQGGAVPFVAHKIGVPMRSIEPEPWSLAIRFRDEPRGTQRHVVARGSAADGASIEDLPVGDDVWVSFILRDGQLAHPRGSTILQPGDEVLTLADPEREQELSELFSRPNGHLDQTSRPDLR